MVLAPTCTAFGCFLSEKGGLVSLPLVTMAGLVDGINPCAIGMIVLLLGYLIVFANKPERVGKTALTYILTVFLTYIAVGLFFYQSITLLQQTILKPGFDIFLGLALLLAGLINIKDFFWPQRGPHLQIPTSSKKHLHQWVEKASIPATITLGFLVTLLETPCSLPVYVGTLTILSQSGMSQLEVAAYFLYYNFLFVLPLIIVALVIWRGQNLIDMREWEEKSKKWMKLTLGIVLVLLASWFILRFFGVPILEGL
ncbi:hypothetical protein A2160_04280 [Candidatus Beckwithbacteria bacterium RBG_13_42_9]|uniref:Cytochrome C biogenesis protein transmembrane domain-containing protein n=1 Tax=Candidatus Beckwithbacteria bacterium RBG_13_42_9 TaxID=1797457 RepID=A0A1F5E6R2_9BACT|nr:MAG: hypothetical protein A2160_04280 [Candidatus Beckwithbacteria bacterium RBG_13_42_9]